MTAILAATDRDARGEWEALRDAIEAGGLEAHLTVFVADDALEQAVAADAKAWVTIGRVPPTKEELLTALERARPQVLHVFSHGTAEDGGFLEVSTPGSAFGDPPLYLEARHVADLRDELWLVTLDACEGATPAGGVHSFAYNLVDSGVPAAIGMREVIDQGDANMFCRAFYTRALSRLAQELLPGTTVEVGWAGAAAAAREALCARVPGPAATTAAFQKPWTLPVLYARSGRFLVDTPAPTPGLDADERERLAAELEAFRRALQNLHPDSPPLVRGQLQEQITRLKSALLGR
jgi:hypothetical protein